jgi:DNA-binding CsgD family transcriptional regulator
MRALLDLVGEANGVADLEEFRAAVIPGIRRVVPAEIISYNEVARDGRVLVGISDPLVPQSLHGAWAEHAHENPLLQRHQRTRDTRPYRFSDVLAQEELTALALYRHFYAPLGIAHQLAFALPSGPDLTVAMALSRSELGDFTDREVRLLDLARPHLAQAYRAALLHERTAGAVDALLRGFEDGGEAVAVLDAEGRIVAISGPARRWLAEIAGGPVEAGERLPAALRLWWDAPGATTAPAPLAAGPGGDERLVARRLRDTRALGYDLLVLERHARSVSREVLRSLGLTEREASVLDGFVRGGSTASVAAALGIAPRTVDKHAQSVHAKLGVRSRTEAIAAAWTAAGLGDGAADLRTSA